MNVDTISDFLGEQRDNAPEDLQALVFSFEDLWERKLWHQLTEVLVQFYALPESGPQRIPIYKHFVLSFSDKINQLKLVTMGLAAASQCKGGIFLIALSLIVFVCNLRNVFLQRRDDAWAFLNRVFANSIIYV